MVPRKQASRAHAPADAKEHGEHVLVAHDVLVPHLPEPEVVRLARALLLLLLLPLLVVQLLLLGSSLGRRERGGLATTGELRSGFEAVRRDPRLLGGQGARVARRLGLPLQLVQEVQLVPAVVGWWWWWWWCRQSGHAGGRYVREGVNVSGFMFMFIIMGRGVMIGPSCIMGHS